MPEIRTVELSMQASVRVLPEFRCLKLTMPVDAWGMPEFQRFHGFRTYKPSGHTTTLHNGRALANVKDTRPNEQRTTDYVGMPGI